MGVRVGGWPSPEILQGPGYRVRELVRPCRDQEIHPDLANKNIGHPVKFEFQVNSE